MQLTGKNNWRTKALAWYKMLWIPGTMLGLFSLVSCAERKSSQTRSLSDDRTTINAKTDTAIFGTGCFWCTEAVFQRLDGVLKVVSGYSGGHVNNPSYEEIGTGTTGHAEACKIVFDPTKISYDDLLEVFWKTHDPTTLNKQGNDIGPQYRSVVFFLDNEQKAKAEYYKAQLNKSGAYTNPVVTTIEPYKNFFSAENYHQNYYNNNPDQMYCRFVIRPKLEKFEKVFKEKLKHQH
jgi:peptide-methionine (S)-S-oxide reductase